MKRLRSRTILFLTVLFYTPVGYPKTATLTCSQAVGAFGIGAETLNIPCTVVMTAPPPVVILPVIPALPASAATIQAGQSTELSWIVDGDTSLTLTGTESTPVPGVNVTPFATTTITLMAPNAAGSMNKPAAVTVALATQSAATTIHNIQSASQKWDSYGQHGPKYVDCSPSPCEGITWSLKHGVTSPSLSNDATEFDLGGTTPYGDVLFTTELIGTNTPKLKDSSHTLLPTLHTFTYDTDFYVSNLSITKTLEFDITMYMEGAKMVWGTQCSHLGDKDWDIYDTANHKWISAGVPCKMVNGWNHLTIQAERGTGNSTVYNSIILDGTTYTLNKAYGPGKANASWWGLTVNYQMDGSSKPAPNTTYLDNFSLTYQ